MPTSKKNHSEPLSFRTRLKVFVTAYEALRDANKPAGVNSTQWISEAADLHERGSIGDAGAFDLIRSRFQEALNTPEHKKLANRSSSFRSSSFDIEEDTISLVTGYHTGTHLIEYGFVRITVRVDYFSICLFSSYEAEDDEEPIVRFEARDKGTRNPDIRSMIDKDVRGWEFSNYHSVARFFQFTDILLNRVFPLREVIKDLEDENASDPEDFSSESHWLKHAFAILRNEARDAVLINLDPRQEKMIDDLLLGPFMEDEFTRFRKIRGVK
jgi:hypothetical protein